MSDAMGRRGTALCFFCSQVVLLWQEGSFKLSADLRPKIEKSAGTMRRCNGSKRRPAMCVSTATQWPGDGDGECAAGWIGGQSHLGACLTEQFNRARHASMQGTPPPGPVLSFPAIKESAAISAAVDSTAPIKPVRHYWTAPSWHAACRSLGARVGGIQGRRPSSPAARGAVVPTEGSIRKTSDLSYFTL